MSENLRYTILFKGEAIEGADINIVKAHFAKLFKANDTKLAQLFSGKVVALKKDLIKSDAAKFQQLFKKAGAKIYIKQTQLSSVAPTLSTQALNQANAEPVSKAQNDITAKPVADETKKPSGDIPDFSIFDDAPAAKKSQPAAESITASQADIAKETIRQQSQEHDLDILPAGSDILTDSERHVFIEADIDLTGISLAEIGAVIETLKTDQQTVSPDISNLSMGAVGETIETLKESKEEISPDISHLSMGEVGELIETLQQERKELSPDTSTLSMGEVGETIETLKEHKEELSPDTSHLSLKD